MSTFLPDDFDFLEEVTRQLDAVPPTGVRSADDLLAPPDDDVSPSEEQHLIRCLARCRGMRRDEQGRERPNYTAEDVALVLRWAHIVRENARVLERLLASDAAGVDVHLGESSPLFEVSAAFSYRPFTL